MRRRSVVVSPHNAAAALLLSLAPPPAPVRVLQVPAGRSLEERFSFRPLPARQSRRRQLDRPRGQIPGVSALMKRPAVGHLSRPTPPTASTASSSPRPRPIQSAGRQKGRAGLRAAAKPADTSPNPRRALAGCPWAGMHKTTGHRSPGRGGSPLILFDFANLMKPRPEPARRDCVCSAGRPSGSPAPS